MEWSKFKCSAVEWREVNWSRVEGRVKQRSAAQRSVECIGVEWIAVEGTEQRSVAWSAVDCGGGVLWSNMEQNGVE